ncbi:MAG: spore coat protein CotJB [Bacilli bacterium]|jgi:spore coat protein JB|nr:spore coat protein CotJB [Bacilli bacterium]
MNLYYNPLQSSLTNIPISNQKQMPIDSQTGFIRGNLFANLYEPYLRSEPFPLKPINQRESLLNKVREYDFALVELDLFLDNHPNDQEKIQLYNQYLKQSKQARQEYEQRYGPLSLNSDWLNTYPWGWLTPPWPWEVS